MRQDQCGFSNKPQEHNACVEKLKHAHFEITDQKAFAASYFLSKIYQNHLVNHVNQDPQISVL